MTKDQNGRQRSDDGKRQPNGQQRRNSAPSRIQRARTAPSVSDLRDYVATLDLPVPASVHVNGPQYPTAILSVDFGQPLRPAKLDQPQTQELVDRMRLAACDVLGRNQSILVSADHQHGVWWASIG